MTLSVGKLKHKNKSNTITQTIKPGDKQMKFLVISGADPVQPIQSLKITKGMVGYTIMFNWPKPKKKKRKWYQFWK